MLFLAVVMDFVLLAEIKIYSIAGIIYIQPISLELVDQILKPVIKCSFLLLLLLLVMV
jgi:hypothetical protein